jgi:hypothetical protein
MNKHSWLVAALLLSIFAIVGHADAGVIFPIDPQTRAPLPAALVTVSVFNQNGQDITDMWLPTWAPASTPQTIYVSFNTGTAAITTAPELVPPSSSPLDGLTNPFLVAPMTTSAYPGRCTNFDSSPAHTGADYTFVATATTIPGTNRQGYALTSEDCGGMAVITVGVANVTYRFVLPQDTNFNGIPDIAEARICPATLLCPTGREDLDAGPVANSPTGDGISAFDEYRGFIVSGQHVSTDARQRDLFIHLVAGQCGTFDNSLLTGAGVNYPADSTGLFDNLASLIPGTQVHLIGYPPTSGNITTEWVDHFSSYTEANGFQYTDDAGLIVRTPPANDRRINKYAVFPLGISIPGSKPAQKGLRITECLEGTAVSPFGTTGIGSTNGPDNSLLYTQRIVNYITTLIQNGAGRPVRVFTFEQGSWVLKTKPANLSDEQFVLSHAMKFYAAHELTHSTRLTPTVEGTSKTSYGYHHAPGTGSIMDQTITQKIDKSGGFNSFYIPSVYNGADQSSYKIKD